MRRLDCEGLLLALLLTSAKGSRQAAQRAQRDAQRRQTWAWRIPISMVRPVD